jgi:glucose-1-phosphate adenylyltransferase
MAAAMYLPDPTHKMPDGKTSLRAMSAAHFAGRYRLIDFTLSNLVNSGVSRVGIVLGSNYQSLVDHIGSGRDWELSRKSGGIRFFSPYISDRRGDGALERAMRSLSAVRQDDVFLCDGTIVYNMDYRPILNRHKAEYADVTEIVDPDGNSLRTYIIRKTVLLSLLTNTNTTDIQAVLAAAHCPINYAIFDSYWGQVSGLAAFYNFNMDMLNKEKRNALFNGSGGQIHTSSRDSLPTFYGSGSNVKNSIIADGCVIDGAVEDCVIFRRVKIGRGTVLKNCIIQEDTEVEEGAKLTNVVTDKNVIVTKNSSLVSTGTLPLYIPADKVV